VAEQPQPKAEPAKLPHPQKSEKPGGVKQPAKTAKKKKKQR
jgi:hypothetical protein